MKWFSYAVLLFFSSAVLADLPGVRVWQTSQPLEKTYKAVYQSLEDNRFWVVFEVDIAGNLKGFADRWGEDFNRNKLDGIRSMVFCNGWYANQVSNQDPRMLALCPLHITLTSGDGMTNILFSRPTHSAAGSDAGNIAKELEDAVAAAIEEGIIKAESD